MHLIAHTVSKVRIGTSMTFQNLTVFPLFGDKGTASHYLTLDEALAQKHASVTEVSEAGSVPELKFSNSGDQSVFLLDGEELIGAKQNRVLNLSIMVPAGKTIVIPVSCVEAGRWRHRSREFTSSPRTQYADGRARKMAQVSMSMKSSGIRSSDQGAIWRDIDLKSTRMKSHSDTSAMSEMFEQEAGRIEDYVQAFHADEGQVGAIFAIDGRLIGYDLFDSAETLRKLLPKLLRSFALDALDALASGSGERKEQQAPTEREAQEFFESVSDAGEKSFPGVGEGEDFRLESGKITGAALTVEGRVVHLSAFKVFDRPGHPDQSL